MTYDVLRMASGDVTAFDLLNTASYVIADWAIQADQSDVSWGATMPDFGMRVTFGPGLEVGSGKAISGYSGIIDFFALTENMQQYVHSTILNNKFSAKVTVYAYSDYDRALAVFTGELLAPYVVNSESTYRPFGHKVFTNNQFVFRDGIKKSASYLLLETGDYLLLETGDKIALEGQS